MPSPFGQGLNSANRRQFWSYCDRINSVYVASEPLPALDVAMHTNHLQCPWHCPDTAEFRFG